MSLWRRDSFPTSDPPRSSSTLELPLVVAAIPDDRANLSESPVAERSTNPCFAATERLVTGRKPKDYSRTLHNNLGAKPIAFVLRPVASNPSGFHGATLTRRRKLARTLSATPTIPRSNIFDADEFLPKQNAPLDGGETTAKTNDVPSTPPTQPVEEDVDDDDDDSESRSFSRASSEVSSKRRRSRRIGSPNVLSEDDEEDEDPEEDFDVASRFDPVVGAAWEDVVSTPERRKAKFARRAESLRFLPLETVCVAARALRQPE